MIDSSRHFLPLESIKKTIDGLMYNKMNILHWHITDEDSFPLIIPTRPELSDSGKIGGTYTLNDVL
jgi:hexosaminidase